MKLVKEQLNEMMRFEQHSSNSIKNLGVGKRSLIAEWLEIMGVKKYVINEDLTINVNENVDLDYKKLTAFPHFIKFRNVKGNFFCNNNFLTNLIGCPDKIDKNFFCAGNLLTSLEGCPEEVKGDFYIGEFDNIKFKEEDIRKKCNIKGVII